MAKEIGEIAEIIKKYKKIQTLMHHINKQTLITEHEQQKSGKARGIDKTSKEEYGQRLEENIEELLKKMKTFSYRPKPVRRTYIPKAGSDKLRPLGIPSYEDKLVQGVMRRILDQIYEEKFYDFSYGFRANKSCHQAIKEVNRIIMTKKTNYVVDADIKGFFDNVNHDWLMKFLENDIEDKNFLRYIKRLLIAGVVEELKYYKCDKGTPQGGLISPVLANIYMHYVLDMWFEKAVKKQCKGEAQIIRYADDFVCFFQYKEEAEKFYRELEERLKKFGLELSKEKSKIIKFGRFAEQSSKGSKTETFDFLGFTHINGKTKEGKYRVHHRSSKKKIKTKKIDVKKWLQENMHERPEKVIAKINKKLIGHYAYYGISGNYKSLYNFCEFVKEAYYRILIKRSQREWLTWDRYHKLLKKIPIAKPKIYVNIWETAKVI